MPRSVRQLPYSWFTIHLVTYLGPPDMGSKFLSAVSPTNLIASRSNEPSLYTRREKLSLQYTTKLAANPKNPAHNCVFNPKYERFYNNTPSAIKPLGLRILPLLEQANISIKNVQPFSLPSKEPWTQNLPRVILDLHKNKKSEVDSHIFKTEFLEIKSAYKHYISIYTDGSKQDEKVACAVISPNFTDSIRLPDNSSIFTAEAKAIDIALYHIRDQPEKQFIIYSDSLSVLRSLKNLDHRNPLIQQFLENIITFHLLRKLFFVGFQATLTFVVTNLLIWKLNLLYHYRSPT